MSRAFIIAVPHTRRRSISACGQFVVKRYGQRYNAKTVMVVVKKVSGLGALMPTQ